VLLGHTARRLDPRTQAWVEQLHSEAHAQLGLAAVRRQLGRMNDALTAAHTVLPAADSPDSTPDDVRTAVAAALQLMPDATADDIADHLTGLGIGVDPDTVRALSGQGTDRQDSTSAAVLPLVKPPVAESVTDTVRRLVRDLSDDPDTVLLGVRAVHGPTVRRETVTRLLHRVKSA
jgi:hypothetical protein